MTETFPWNLKPGDTVTWHELGDRTSSEHETVTIEMVWYMGTKGDDGCLISIKATERTDWINAFWPELIQHRNSAKTTKSGTASAEDFSNDMKGHPK